jgi:hypothetical protein
LDFNRDGHLDAVVCSSETNLLARLQGLGDGTFSLLPPLSLISSSALAVAAGDFNQDNFPDVVVVGGDRDRLEVRLNDAMGGFGSPLFVPVGQTPQDVAVGDIDHDGRLDLAIANRADQSITLLRGSGNGIFAPLGTLPLPGGGQRVLLADMDGDGNLDLLAASGWQAFDATTLSVFWGIGDGGFLTGSNYVTGLGAGLFTTADFNGDGLPDLAVGNQGTATLFFLLGRPGRQFVRGPVLSTGPLCATLAGDLDNDGRPDVGMLSTSGSCVTALLNASIAPATIARLPGGVRVSWPAWRGLVLETADRLALNPVWTPLASNAPGATGMCSITNDALTPARFFRLTGSGGN